MGGFVNDSYIEGDVDFMWAQESILPELRTEDADFKWLLHQIRNVSGKNGNVYVNCRLTAAPGVTGGWLGESIRLSFPSARCLTTPRGRRLFLLAGC
jgi:hypothetical protein